VKRGRCLPSVEEKLVLARRKEGENNKKKKTGGGLGPRWHTTVETAVAQSERTKTDQGKEVKEQRSAYEGKRETERIS